MAFQRPQPAPADPGRRSWDLTTADLGALRAAANITSREVGPPLLHSVYFTAGGFVATDIHRLLRYCSPALTDVPEVIVEAAWTRVLRDQHGTAATAQLTFGAAQMELTLGDGERLTGAFLTGRYLGWRRVLPADWRGRAVASVADWQAALELLQQRQTAAAAERGMSPEPHPGMRVVLSAEEGCVWLGNAGTEGEEPAEPGAVRVALPARITLQEERSRPSFGVNLTYLEQALESLGQPPEGLIKLCCGEPRDPFVLAPVGSDQVFVVIMPMLLPEPEAG